MRNFNCTGLDEPVVRTADAQTASLDHLMIAEPPAHRPCMEAPQHGERAGFEAEGELMIADPALKPKRPPMYKVILMNDDYTPMDFVVMVLESIFHKDHADALEIMLQVHNKGAAHVGTYTRDVAETKAGLVIEHARINEYPLQCLVEKE